MFRKINGIYYNFDTVSRFCFGEGKSDNDRRIKLYFINGGDIKINTNPTNYNMFISYITND